ncbi:MAG: TonB-dependent receptor plug domain-containing protein [Hyphomicrobiaceae bacterium]
MLPSAIALAQDVSLEGIIIDSASRTPLDINKVGSTVEVVDREDIERYSETTVKDYLARLPGITFTQNGPPGTTTTIQMRGGYGRYIKVLVDGVDISDPSAPQVAASLEHLLVGDLERIEVLKGSQSTLYGTEAVAGVVSLTTRRAKRGYAASVNMEGGSYNTGRGGATVSYGAEKWSAVASVIGLKTGGFSAADENDGNTEDDPYENTTFSGSGDVKVADGVTLFFAGRQVRSDIEYDGFPPPTYTFQDTEDGTITHSRAGKVGAHVNLFNDKFRNTFSYQMSDSERDIYGSFTGWYKGQRKKFEYQGISEFAKQFSLMVGADHDRLSASSSGDPVERDVSITGLFAQALIEPIENLNFTVGGRRDDHDAFGTFDTYRITGAYFIPRTDTKFRASYGTAFRAPSLYELYSPLYGTPDLDPEESDGWDAGIDQGFLGGKVKLSATYFRLDTENLITFVFSPTPCDCYVQTPGVTERQGVELTAGFQLMPNLFFGVNYTYTDTEEPDGTRLIRVPKHALTLTGEYRPIDRLSLLVSANIVDDTLDNGDIALDDYVLLNAKVSYDLNKNVSAYIRGENLLDQEYQTVIGYGTSDLAVYGGLRIRFGDE